ncbi:Sulfoquinovosyl transferase SQD2-like protein [Drosera capensis]
MTTSLSINHIHPNSTNNISSPSSLYSSSPTCSFLLLCSSTAQRPNPICLSCSKIESFRVDSKRVGARFGVSATMATGKEKEREEEEGPILEEIETSRPRRIALFVEPSPFAYVSGYKNRFQNFIKYLREMGDEVMVVTTHEGVPQEFYGAKLIGSRSFPCPWYQKVPLSLALSPRIISEVAAFKPDIIHASSPGIMVFGALAIAKMLCVPIVMSYHTHVPVYIPRYTFSWLVKPMWMVIKFLHQAADLTLVPSAAIGRDLEAENVTTANKIRLWNKGVDSESFHPRFRSYEMRLRLSGGEPDKPLLVHVGRLGVEKSLDFCKRVMDAIPCARIAFIGDGPYRVDLEKMFVGMPAVFTGMLSGEELSQAYASGDVFLMPSESETLGLVVLEAMSSGIPVVAARAGGIIDIIPEEQEGKTGFCYTPGDLEDCLNKLKPLLVSEDLRGTIGKAARSEVEKYDWRAATRKIRNEQYTAAIWFWRKKRAQVLRPVQWLVKLFTKSPEVGYR